MVTLPRRNDSEAARLALLATASGLLYAGAFPPLDLGPMAFVALVPLLLAIAGGSWRRVFLLGWLAGTVAINPLTSPSIYEAARRYFGGDSLAAALLAFAIPQLHGALYFGFFALLARGWERLSPALACLLVPAAWVACEWLRATLGWGCPWVLLGHSQHDRLWIIQVADLAGVFAISFAVAMVNTLLASFVLAQRQQRRPSLAAAAIVLVVLASLWSYGELRLSPRPASSSDALLPPLRILIVQPALDTVGRASLIRLPANLKRFETLTRDGLRNYQADLVVWPENSVGFSLAANAPLLAEAASGLPPQSRLLLGAPREIDSGDGVRFRNAAFLVDPSGAVEVTYDKVRLTPFAETTPWSGLSRAFAAGDVYTRGERMTLFEVKLAHFATLICSEAIYPDLARQAVALGAQFLVNISNDDWFGGRAALTQHFEASLFRAVETHRWMVRATNTGISAVVAPNGAVVATAPLGEAATIAARVDVEHELTFYTRYGDIFAWMCLIVSTPMLIRRRL